MKNIVIFADGTGQIGGLRPDQRLSNVYKMYRAMRPGPSSPISYRDQVTYYDPGLGAGEIDGVTPSKIKSVLEAAVGAGIEDNMIDCYAKIISYYEPGDRIILIGFSRGAYTVRALANMMNLCGVPTQLPNGAPIPRYGPALRAVATEAVKSVYSHGTGKPRDKQPYFRQREEKGRRFRVTYGCTACDGSDNLRGNVEPDFVGVFDTVAALQNAAVIWLVRGVFAATLLLLAASIIFSWHGAWSLVFGLLTGAALIGYARTVKIQIRYFEQNPDTPLNLWDPRSWPRIIGNTHRAYWRKENYDRWLSPKVGFARHALSIDENRADFPRVGWGTLAAVEENRGKKPEWLEQIWFAGCHSDVGGSYPEDESRLSDIALEWMVGELKACIPSIQVRKEFLVTTPDPLGLQHDEVWMMKRWFFRKRWKRLPRLVESEFSLHPTVVERLKASAVPDPECSRPYRPPQLAGHPQATEYFA
ncbi:DUF2235 domain-containing protein [Sphingopyxis panaciterrulae]|uniref:Uncharacterized protein (DUF2235 family) n=1 Tax=Sphingopyxis panaciterrulae TaxID=462372 RepID=A0A7W9B990_9SPHN|nr:DUF2235 domain-containing protein [Sphingopyxis panaciterrulae]MBB5708593.1 uncharacterized protein (DUF2235 family) [Sphingopyxis panaciterrulae]